MIFVFPYNEPTTNDGERSVSTQYPGLSLRDYLAITASEEDVESMIDSVLRLNPTPTKREFSLSCATTRPDNWRQIARYLHADAMLAAREKGSAE